MAHDARANVGRYDLTEWLQFRAQALEQHQQQIQQLQAAAAAEGIENPPLPDPPNIPEIPPAFDANLMPDWDGEFQTFAPFMKHMTVESQDTHTWLKSIRQPKEKLWKERRQYYDMAEELAFDRNRKKSINKVSKFRPDAELNPERMAMVLPLIFEATQLLYARIYMAMLGTGDGFVELLGRERNDIQGAKNLEKFMNFQQSHEIPTEEVLADYVLDGFIYGTGVMFQDWDAVENQRKMRSISRLDIWWDLAQWFDEIKVMRIRREASIGELEDLRNAGRLWFSNEDLKAASDGQHIEHERETVSSQTDADPRANARAQRNIKLDQINRRYRKVFLDIQMDTEPWRWVYVVNESLIVGVVPPLIPEDEERGVKARFPVSIFSPIRRIRDLDGDSFVGRALDSQDIINATLELLMSNIKANSLGIGITNDESLQDKPLRAGFWHYSSDPKATQIINFPDISASTLGVIDWFTSRVIDRITGTNDITRGRAQFSGQTATATRDLLQQATTRLTPMERRALKSMQDIYSVAIALNRMYLAPHKFIRVVGGKALQHLSAGAPEGVGLEGADFLGLAGQDLVPTGFPGSASAITQETLNEAAVVAQTGGDPRPLMREYIKTRWKGRINVDEIYPENGIGNDPVQENENLLNGIPPTRDPDDVDSWHLQVHQSLETDKRYLEAVQANPMLEVIRQQHMQVHSQAMQQQAALFAGIAPGSHGGGFGNGVGTSGLSTSMLGARPKPDRERESQVGAERARATR